MPVRRRGHAWTRRTVAAPAAALGRKRAAPAPFVPISTRRRTPAYIIGAQPDVPLLVALIGQVMAGHDVALALDAPLPAAVRNVVDLTLDDDALPADALPFVVDIALSPAADALPAADAVLPDADVALPDADASLPEADALPAADVALPDVAPPAADALPADDPPLFAETRPGYSAAIVFAELDDGDDDDIVAVEDQARPLCTVMYPFDPPSAAFRIVDFGHLEGEFCARLVEGDASWCEFIVHTNRRARQHIQVRRRDLRAASWAGHTRALHVVRHYFSVDATALHLLPPPPVIDSTSL
jgi:hypothetical protein